MIYLLLYVLSISIIGFIVFGIDKYKAIHNHTRIREKDLLLLTALGGGIGARLAMKCFRHKTIKHTFLRKFRLIIFIQTLFFALIYHKDTIVQLTF